MMNLGYLCGGAGWTMMIGSWLIPILLILGGIWLVKIVIDQGRSHGGRKAVDVLDERYAKGEISKEEYAEKKKDLIG